MARSLFVGPKNKVPSSNEKTIGYCGTLGAFAAICVWRYFQVRRRSFVCG